MLSRRCLHLYRISAIKQELSVKKVRQAELRWSYRRNGYNQKTSLLLSSSKLDVVASGAYMRYATRCLDSWDVVRDACRPTEDSRLIVSFLQTKSVQTFSTYCERHSLSGLDSRNTCTNAQKKLQSTFILTLLLSKVFNKTSNLQ